MADRRRVGFRINGHPCSVDVEPRKLLVDVLREDLRLTGTHVGCEHGVCGACTVLCNGRPVRSCLMFAVQAEGAEIETVEALAPAERLHPIQEAFWEEHGLQCGFCTPGVLIMTKYLLGRNPSPSREEIREAIAGNLCRCTGYTNIVNAVERAALSLRTSSPSSAGMPDPRQEVP